MHVYIVYCNLLACGCAGKILAGCLEKLHWFFLLWVLIPEAGTSSVEVSPVKRT